MRFCLLVEQPGAYSVNGYLEFSIEGTKIRQPVGTHDGHSWRIKLQHV